MPAQPVLAACQAQSTDYGSATTTVSVPANATYRIWSRMQTPTASSNSYLLEIDGGNCYNVGGSNMATNSWVWVSHKDGNAGSKVDVSLSQGNHTLKFIGKYAGFKLDRVILVSDMSCVPSGNGDNCDTPKDTTAPVVDLTSPAASSTLAGTVNLTATASDASGVTKVEFYVNSKLLGTDTSAPYSMAWDTTKEVNGQFTLTAKAYDSANNISSDGYKVNVQNGGSDTQAPTVPSGVTAAAEGQKVTLKWQASTDNVGVKGYIITRNGARLADVGAVTTYEDMSVSPSTDYVYLIAAVDAAGNKSAPSAPVNATTPAVPDSEAPSAPAELSAKTVSAWQINLSWQPSKDNIGVVAYDIYRKVNNQNEKIGSVTSTSFGVGSLTPNTQYTFYVVARDAAGNMSAPSNDASEKTQPMKRKGFIWGKVTDNSGKGLKNVRVIVERNNNRQVYRTTSSGMYIAKNLDAGKYNVSFRAQGYKSLTSTVRVNDNATVTKNVKLQKR